MRSVKLACVVLVVALIGLVSPRGFAEEKEAGFTSLFNGKDLAGWVYGGGQGRRTDIR